MTADLTLADVYARLRAAVREAGSQQAFAAKHGISPQWVSDVLNAKREPGAMILAALGLVRVVVYRPAKSGNGRIAA